MFEIICYIISLSMVVVSIFVGISYMKENSNKEYNSQEVVHKNLNVFGLNDSETSLDDKDIYLVPYSKIGLKK